MAKGVVLNTQPQSCTGAKKCCSFLMIFQNVLCLWRNKNYHILQHNVINEYGLIWILELKVSFTEKCSRKLIFFNIKQANCHITLTKLFNLSTYSFSFFFLHVYRCPCSCNTSNSYHLRGDITIH